MNTNFAFPRPQPAVPRPTAAAKSSPDFAGSRESNALRASILDTALELGIGSNSLVADWMFNNPLMEETEEELESVTSPPLTCGSPTSEESVLSPPSSLLHSQLRRDPIINANGNGINFNLNQNVNKSGPLIFHRKDPVAVGSSQFSDIDSQSSNIKVHFNANEMTSNINVSNFQTINFNDSGATSSDIPIPPRPTTPSGRKLRKKRATGDGYESDGGYVSETGKKKDKKKPNSGEGQNIKQRLKEEKKGEEEERKKKSFIRVINRISTTHDTQSSMMKGYETDGGAVPSSSKLKAKTKKSKTKNSSNQTGYETDGGYQSSSDLKKSKTRFFKLPTKSSKGDLRVDASESIPALPNHAEKKRESAIPLPIAERFATTLSPDSTLSYSITTEGGDSRMGSPLPTLAFQSFPAASELTSTTSLPSPVSAGLSTSNRPATAPTSGSPSAFSAIVTHLNPKNRDSRSSFASSSSSGSGSNQPHKSQKRMGLFSPLHSPPSSMQGHQQQGLRTALSLSSLKHPHSVISLPITRATSPIPADLPSSPPFVSNTSSVAPLQINKAQRIKSHLDNLSPPTQQHPPARSVSPSSKLGSPHVLLTPTVPISQTPSSGPVRPRNPPTDGFGPRSAPTPNSGPGSTTSPNPTFPPADSNSSNDGLSPHQYNQGHSQRTSQLSIIPSSDYLVPSPRSSPLKMHTPGMPSPSALTAYYHYDHIPPQVSPAPIGPLPTLPGQQLPSPTQLRQRMTIMRQSVQQDYGIVRGSFFPSRPAVPSSQSTGSVGVDDSGLETGGGIRQYRDLEKSPDRPSAAKYQEKKIAAGQPRPTRVALNNRQSWIDLDDDIKMDKREKKLEADDGEESDEFEEILDRFESRSDESSDIHHSSSGGEHALERSQSFKAGKIENEQRQYHPDNVDARRRLPRQNNKAVVPADAGGGGGGGDFEDDGTRTVGDRTSRWSGSVYSRVSILDEDESEETRNRFVRRVEAMLDAERMAKNVAQGGQAQPYIPPLPKIPDAYSKIIHKPNRDINENAHSNITPGRSWNKF